MSAQPFKQVTRDLREVVVLLLGMRKHMLERSGGKRHNDEDVLVLAAIDRIGGLADRSISALGEIPVVGGPEAWAQSQG